MKNLKIFLVFLISLLLPSLCFAALDAAITWEIHTTGESSSASMNNGGGFKAGAAGTDYSQGGSLPANGAPILNLTDLACLDTATNLTSVTGGFTDAMVGNVVHIVSGTQAVVGWYEITARTDTNTVVIDRTCAVGGQNMTAATGNIGGALALGSALDDEFFEAITAGNTVYISANGTTGTTHTPGETLSIGLDGNTTNMCKIEGYNTSRDDNPVGANRPTIAMGANTLFFDNFWSFKNLIVTTTQATGFDVDNDSIFENCKSTNSSGTSGRRAFTLGIGGNVMARCEGVSTNGDGVAVDENSEKIISCYFHDCGQDGIQVGSSKHSLFFVGNIFALNTTGISYGTSNNRSLIAYNTFYKNTTGLAMSSANRQTVHSNIFDANTTGATATTLSDSIWFDYNCWDNVTTDVTNITKGDNSVTGDPGLTDPDNGDFTLGSGSNCLDAGMQVGTDQGAVGDYKWNIGADQDDVTAAGTGGGAGWVAITP